MFEYEKNVLMLEFQGKKQLSTQRFPKMKEFFYVFFFFQRKNCNHASVNVLIFFCI